MKWYSYIGYFFAGMLLVNAVPHFVMGITGQEFQTPFANPSSPTANVLWGFLNLIVGYIIIAALGGLDLKFNMKTAVTALGALTLAIMLSFAFA